MSFEQALTNAGLLPKKQAVADGKWHRCPTKDKPKSSNGAYKLLPCGTRGFYQNHALHEGVVEWTETVNCPKCAAENEHWRRRCEACGADLPAAAQPVIDWAAIEARKRKEREEQRQAIAEARELYLTAYAYEPHPYLTNKGLSAAGCSDLRLWDGEMPVRDEDADRWVMVHDRWLVVPMFIRGHQVNVQRISSDGRIKRPYTKAPAQGAYFELNRPRAAVTVLAEGFATGLAVYQSMRHARVIVTFNADGLLRVAQELRPTGSVVIAADNDWETAARGRGNPGIQKAEKAAEAIGCGVAWPEHIQGSDWCDAFKEWGERAPQRIQREILAKARLVQAQAGP